MLLSQFVSFPHCVHKFILYVCVSTPALEIGSSIPFFWIPYIFANMQYLFFSFKLTSFCIIGCRFIHLTLTDSNSFCFMTEEYSIVGLPGWLSSKESTCQCRKCGFTPWEDALEKEMATHSSILAWGIPWTEEPGGPRSTGSQKSWT